PSGLVVSNADGILTISGTPSTNITTSSELGYTVTTTNSGCTPAKEYSGTISISPQPILLINSGTNTQTICEGVAMTNIVIDAAQGANNAIISWDVQPPGIFGQFDATTSQFTISGSPSGINEDTTYNYSVKAINSIDGCESDPFTGSITVLNGHTLQLLSGSSSVNQTFCEGEELPFPISYEFGGGALAARVLGLPPGLNWSITDNRITISGTPTLNVSSTSTNTYTYTVETIGASCIPITETGVIDLVPNPMIQLISGLNTQSVCEDEAIVDIVYNTIDGAENVDLTWDSQPNGIYGNFDSTTGQFTISGTPTGLVEDKVYNYTIQAVNLSNNCVSSELTGSISVQNGHDLKLLSGSTSTNQSLCEGLDLSQDIVYEFSGGANSARVLGLPPGVGWTVTGNVITISGSASENISSQTDYVFTVETLGNSCTSASLDGQITIHPDAEITLSTPSSTVNQFICEGESIDPITYTFGGGTVDAVPSGLPPGITGTYNASTRIMTISGTPTQNVEIDTSYNFTVRALNDQGCESPELTGEITVKANAELTLLSSTNTIDQTVCVNSNISDIRIRFKNSSVPSANNLPSGLSSEVVGTDVLRIFGSVSVGGPYTFDVIGTNTNGCSSTAVTVQLTVVPDYSINPTKVVLDMNDPSNGTDESLVKNISCFGNSDGEIKVNLSNDSSTLSYIYSWSGPNNYANTTQSNHIKNLKPGNYTVSVFPQGNSDCPVTASFTVVQPNPTDISINNISPVSCTGADDGLISVSITGGNSFYYKNYIWEVLEEDENCVTYTIKLRDTDNDGIFDIADADIDNDGVVDPNKSDTNGDGIIDEATGGNFSYSIVSYQSCDGTFITDNKQSLSDFSSNGVYQICAVPNSVSSDANLDHDLDANTPNISSVVISGGTASCSSGSWQKIDRLKGTTYADNLTAGLYRLTVVEGPDLADIESLDIDDLRNDPDVCITDQIFELPKDQILYGSVRVDEAYCSLTGGYIDIDVNQSAGEVYFYYDGVRIPSADISIVAAEFGINTHRVLITAPVSEASFEIRNANGCGVVVAQDLLDTSVLTPIINYTSPELEKYGTISERSNVLFTLANNTSYYNVEWDFGDASPVATGERVSHQYFADGTYKVTVYVYNASGCFTTATQEIIVGKGYTILMPNAFSPNGDNINEIIGPVFTGLKAVDFFIYNKQGILVYQESVSETNLSEDGTIEIQGWDGTNSDPASNFYVYKIIGVRINDEIVTKTGTIFLIE
ncbi:MAG: PKD domain-containing protein, partial [Flavobacteriaceae bacterium]